MAWDRLLRRNVTPFVNVSSEEVNELYERVVSAKGTAEYRIGEIYLSANPTNRAAVAENAKRIVDQLRQGRASSPMHGSSPNRRPLRRAVTSAGSASSSCRTRSSRRWCAR